MEYRFRGKRIDNGEWVYGNKLEIYNQIFIVPFETGISYSPYSGLNLKDWFEIIPKTVGQYTGLQDKDGVDIYEGDIVSLLDMAFEFVVAYDRIGFRFKDINTDDKLNIFISGNDNYEEIIKSIKITGNIHDEE